MRFAAADDVRAALVRRRGEQPLDRLPETRAAVRRAAVRVLRESDVDTAVLVMMGRVRELWVREPPLLGFDEAMVDYTAARTWQWCARELDPTTTEIQARWS